jgi:hypothetical protein
MFWVISVYFNIRNTLPKSGTFLLGHPVYYNVNLVGRCLEVLVAVSPLWDVISYTMAVRRLEFLTVVTSFRRLVSYVVTSVICYTAACPPTYCTTLYNFAVPWLYCGRPKSGVVTSRMVGRLKMELIYIVLVVVSHLCKQRPSPKRL